MNKIFATAALLMGVVASANAIEPSGTTIWGCAKPGAVSSKFGYCAVNITSATTSAQLGQIQIDPRKVVYTAIRSSVALSPTINYSLNNVTVYSLTVSASTTPQIVNPAPVPFYDAITISMSTPSSISATNAISMTVIENALKQ